MTELIIQTGKHQGKTIDLAGTDCIIGRHESCKIRIASEEVSKQHCRLKHKADGVYLKDLGSRNGTFLNDEPISGEVKLKVGDLLRVGPMAFLIGQSKAAPTKPGSAVPASSGKASGGSADDDMIAAWLSEGGDLEKSGHDSTVVIPAAGAKSQVPQPAATPAAQTVPAAEKKDAAAADPGAKSIKQRSEEIIRRWHKIQGKG